MKKAVYAFALLAICSVSCRREKKNILNERQIKAKVDSIISSRLNDINSQYAEDLDRRMAIEIKVKTDSLVQKCLEIVPPPAPDLAPAEQAVLPLNSEP